MNHARICAIVFLAMMAALGAGCTNQPPAPPPPPPSSPSSPPRVFLLDATKLAETRRRARDGDPQLQPAIDALKHDAQQALAAGPFSVMHKPVLPPSGDKHD